MLGCESAQLLTVERGGVPAQRLWGRHINGDGAVIIPSFALNASGSPKRSDFLVRI